jgi:thiol-disulfide isomerase/thioredoxin
MRGTGTTGHGVTTRRLALGLALASSALLGAGPVAAPEVTAGRWLNSAPLSIKELRGKVVLVEFWTFACWNCRNVEPAMKRWHAQYKDRGLVVIGVHTPELDEERDPKNVETYVREHGIDYPVAIDNDFATWRRYRNEYWPALYLVDRDGRIVYSHIGEGAYDETARRIELALGSTPAPTAPPPAPTRVSE